MESSDEEISSEEEEGSEEQVRAFVFSGLVGRFAGMQVCSMTALNLPAAALCLPALGFGCCGGWGKVCTFAGLCSGCFKPSCCSPVLACRIGSLLKHPPWFPPPLAPHSLQEGSEYEGSEEEEEEEEDSLLPDDDDEEEEVRAPWGWLCFCSLGLLLVRFEASNLGGIGPVGAECALWAHNLQDQGFLDRATAGTLEHHLQKPDELGVLAAGALVGEDVSAQVHVCCFFAWMVESVVGLLVCTYAWFIHLLLCCTLLDSPFLPSHLLALHLQVGKKRPRGGAKKKGRQTEASKPKSTKKKKKTGQVGPLGGQCWQALGKNICTLKRFLA